MDLTLDPTLALPMPTDLGSLARINHTRLRRRMLYSAHDGDVKTRMQRDVGGQRQKVWGEPDMTANGFKARCERVSVQYRVAPEVHPPDGGEEVAVALAAGGHWALMPRIQRDTLGMREMFVAIEADGDGGIVSMPVFPDLVEATPNPRRPWTPARVVELRPIAEIGWVRIINDCRAGVEPVLRAVLAADDRTDVTEKVFGKADLSGDKYPWIYEGKPEIQYVVYHADHTAALFDPYTGRESVEGALNMGALLTFYRHAVEQVSWKQRYGMNVQPAGEDTDERQEMTTDPATVALFKQAAGVDAQGMLGQWDNPVDVEALLRSVFAYEARIMEMDGLGGASVTRTEADIRSGYSLAVERDSLREMQRAHEEQFRWGDDSAMRKAAIILGTIKGRSFPVDAYRYKYMGLPRSLAEEKMLTDLVLAQLAAGLTSKIDACVRLFPELTPEAAEKRLLDIININRRLAA